MGSGAIDGAGTGNDSRVPDADHRDSPGRQGRSLLGLTRSLRSDRRKDEDLVKADDYVTIYISLPDCLVTPPTQIN